MGGGGVGIQAVAMVTATDYDVDTMICDVAEAVWAVGVCALIVVYFPSKPYVPPSASSVVHREDFVAGSKALFRSVSHFTGFSTKVFRFTFRQI